MKKQIRSKSKKFKLERVKSYKTICEQMRKIAPLVADILSKNIEARDDDNILYIEVWKRQGMKEMGSFKSFKYKLIMGKFASSDTIGRSRRKLQEKNKSLRGALYKERHNAEKEIRNQLKFPYNF